MKILVPVKRVLDYKLKPRVHKETGAIDLTGSKMSINPFDEIAVEEALRIKEKGKATEVVVVSIGEKKCEETLRFALALGADRAILVETPKLLFPLDVAKTLAKIVDLEEPELVVMGKQAIDSDFNQTGQMLAGLLGWPQAVFISDLKVEEDRVEVSREVDAGIEDLALSLPAVVTTDLRLNTPRYAALPNIMKAKTKPLQVMSWEELGVPETDALRVIKYAFPGDRKKGETLATVDELLGRLDIKGEG